MPNLHNVEPSNASKEVLDLYNDFNNRMGFPETPNFLKAQGASEAAVRGTWGLVRSVLVEGELPRSLKEMIFVAISIDRECRYCEAAHLACCRMLGVDPKTLEALVANINDVEPAAAREALRFAVKCSRSPQSLTEQDFKSLRDHGFVDSKITEIISMSGLAVYANIVADATGVLPDAMFGAF
jgi:uncharacterized peroxidase-related enzyme